MATRILKPFGLGPFVHFYAGWIRTPRPYRKTRRTNALSPEGVLSTRTGQITFSASCVCPNPGSFSRADVASRPRESKPGDRHSLAAFCPQAWLRFSVLPPRSRLALPRLSGIPEAMTSVRLYSHSAPPTPATVFPSTVPGAPHSVHRFSPLHAQVQRSIQATRTPDFLRNCNPWTWPLGPLQIGFSQTFSRLPTGHFLITDTPHHPRFSQPLPGAGNDH